MNKTLVFAGVVTLVQAIGQMFFTGFSLAQYYCVIDFLRDIPLVIFLRILYLHNPETCGTRINVGEALDNVPNQAFVLLRNEPFTTTRTFYINCIYLGLCGVWILFSVVMIMGGARGMVSKHVRWPWVVVTSLVTVLDLVAIVTYANDSFHTQSLGDMLDFIGGTASGLGNAEIKTTLVSWTMVFIYSRIGVLLAFNLCLIIVITVECGLIRNKMEDDQVPIVPVLRTVDESVQVEVASVTNDTRDIEGSSVHSLPPVLPRVGLSQSFRRMKQLLFKRPSTRSSRYDVNLSSVTPDGQTDLPPPPPPPEMDKKRTVNFPVNLLSLPQRLENLIAEQQKRLDTSVVDTSGRMRASQSLPHLETATQVEAPRPEFLSRRGTAAELQGQLPWAYIPASAHPMRDQLPPDEDLPPVPLPDYTAIPSFRKASVHRAASSLSSLTRKKEYKSGTRWEYNVY